MRVGTVRERKDGENRVALTPEAVYALVSAGSEVVLEASAGVGAGYGDAAYTAVGGTVVADASAVWSTSDLVVKVKEPVPAEYDQLVPRDPQPTLFTYLHLAADRPLTERLLASGWTTLAYELVARPDGSLPLLAPMSQVAGRMAAEVGAGLLKQPGPGKGKLLGGIAGVAAGKVVILGSGAVATAAVRVLLGSEARIVVMSRDLARLSYLQEHFGGRITTRTSSPQSVAEELEDADLVILAVLVPGATAPRVVTREMLRRMESGGVLVDVSIDQGGAAETSRPTTHSDPTYVEEGIVHYCVTNMPGAVPHTSTLSLASATLPYIETLAALGTEAALAADQALARALSTYAGRLTSAPVAAALGLPAAANPFLAG